MKGTDRGRVQQSVNTALHLSVVGRSFRVHDELEVHLSFKAGLLCRFRILNLFLECLHASV